MAENGGQPDWWDEVEQAERDDLMVDGDTRREYIKIQRRGWSEPKGAWFDIHDPPWNKKKQILSECITADASGDGEMHLDEYYRDMLDYMIDDSSVGINNINQFLRGINDEAGTGLEEFVPKPSAQGITEAEEGKSEPPSGETEDGSEEEEEEEE